MSQFDPNPFRFALVIGGKSSGVMRGCVPNWRVRFAIRGWRNLWAMLRRGYAVEFLASGPEEYAVLDLAHHAFDMIGPIESHVWRGYLRHGEQDGN